MATRELFTGSEQYKLSGVRVTDRELGHGSYATVLQLDYMGLKCAGKKIHDVLVNQGATSYSVHRFEEECRLLSQVRHPNIVQFLGVHFQEGVTAPILVMEFLPTNLTSCIEQYGILPKEVSYSILHDVALGLCYLHSQTPPIIHRDLSSNNVLLTANMTAKISDLGVARILNVNSLQASRMTNNPGTPAYMPPEVMVADPTYDSSVDVFSYGIMMIHVFSGRWPEPQAGPNVIQRGELVPLTEAERRGIFLQAIQDRNPLMDLIYRCIDNDPCARATANEIVRQLAEMVSQFPIAYSNRPEKIHSLELEQLQVQIKDLNTKVQLAHEEKKAQAIELNASISVMKATIDANNLVISGKDAEIKAKMRALEERGAIISEMNNQLDRAREHLTTRKQTLQTGLHVTWESCPELKTKLSESKTTVVNGKVYCGGGGVDVKNDHFIVFCFDPNLNIWSKLPPLHYIFFGLGRINNELVAVGGTVMGSFKRILTERVTDRIFKYDERSKEWKEFLPSMPMARHSPGILSLKQGLLVAGGYMASGDFANSVEIYKSDTNQWHRTDPLPIDCCDVSLVAIGNYCHVLGGYKSPSHLNQALRASVDDLLRNAVPASQISPSAGTTSYSRRDTYESAWKQLPVTPTYRPAATVLAGNLLAVGGVETSKGESETNSIVDKREVYIYSPSANSWIYLTDLPEPRSEISVNAMSSTEILVIGGLFGGAKVNTVYKGTLNLEF